MAKAKIVFLDAGTVDWGGDQAFSSLKKLGKLKTYHQTFPHQVLGRIAGFAHVITNKVVLDKAVFFKLKNVAAVHVAATGVNNVDLAAAKEKGIAVTNARGYSTESVVQMTFTHLLALFSRLPEYQKLVQRGDWSRQEFPCLTTLPFSELSGKTIGIIGYGTIGKRVAQVARALNMQVWVARLPGISYTKKESESRFSLQRTLKNADVVTIHARLSDQTRNLISFNELQLMKRSAFLINMARGGIVVEKALAHALKRGQIAGAASDVTVQEPLPRKHVLYNLPRFILTPHIAWASVEARARLVDEVARNIESYEKGKKRNRLV